MKLTVAFGARSLSAVVRRAGARCYASLRGAVAKLWGFLERLEFRLLASPWSEKELLRRYARRVLEVEGGVKGRAIEVLGIDWKTLKRRLE